MALRAYERCWTGLCDPMSNTCGPYIPGTTTLAWFDARHLSTAGSLYLGSFVHCWLGEQGLL